MIRIVALALLLLPSLARAQAYRICEGENGKWTFCRDGRRIHENDFIRDYRERTQRNDLDRALKMRNRVALVALGIVAGLSIVEALASIPVAERFSGGDGFAIVIPVAMWATAGIGFVGGSLGFAIAAFLRDGTVRSHLLKKEEAQAAVERYNATLVAPPPPDPAGRLEIVPYIGPNGFGIAGRF
jgi:hypothetical protein